MILTDTTLVRESLDFIIAGDPPTYVIIHNLLISEATFPDVSILHHWAGKQAD